MTTRPTPPARALASRVEEGPQEMSGVLMLVAVLLVLSALGLVVT